MTLDDLLHLVRIGYIDFYTEMGSSPDGQLYGNLHECILTNAITQEMNSAITEAMKDNPVLFPLVHYSWAIACGDPGMHEQSYYQRGDLTYCADCERKRVTLLAERLVKGKVNAL